MPSVMDHPFFALAMSLRPLESDGGVLVGSTETPQTPESSPQKKFNDLIPTPDSGEWLPCPKCPEGSKTFASEFALRMHLASELHRGGTTGGGAEGGRYCADKKGWVCLRCSDGRVFKSELALRMHFVSQGYDLDSSRVGADPVPAEQEQEDARVNGEYSGVIEAPSIVPEPVHTPERRTSMSSTSTPESRIGPTRTTSESGTAETTASTPDSRTPEPSIAASGSYTSEPMMSTPGSPTGQPTVSNPDSHAIDPIKAITLAITDTKRVTFSDQMLHTLNTHLFQTQIIILSSTRDMALYVDTILTTRCEPFGITCYACVGGTIVREDMRNLEGGPHIVSGTPGRVGDMIRRGSLSVEGVKMLVLNKEEELLRRTMREGVAEVYCLLRPDTKIARASVRVPGALAVVERKALG